VRLFGQPFQLSDDATEQSRIGLQTFLDGEIHPRLNDRLADFVSRDLLPFIGGSRNADGLVRLATVRLLRYVAYRVPFAMLISKVQAASLSGGDGLLIGFSNREIRFGQNTTSASPDGMDSFFLMRVNIPVPTRGSVHR